MYDFNEYFEKIVKNTKHFFYATHMTSGGEMIKVKLDIIDKDFKLVDQIISEGGGVQNNLYVRC